MAVEDPDPNVSGRGVAALRSAGIPVDVGVGAEAVTDQLAPYLYHRRTGRPYVVVKTAATLDGTTAARDGMSQWITGPEARVDAHKLRAESDAILVGAGTVRSDNPRLTVRGVLAADGQPPRPPRRVVLGLAATDASIHPCTELSGPVEQVVDQLGSDGIVQLMVEGGATVAWQFHAAGLVQRYVLYLAPALYGGNDGRGMFDGSGPDTLSAMFRGTIKSTTSLGSDIRVDLVP